MASHGCGSRGVRAMFMKTKKMAMAVAGLVLSAPLLAAQTLITDVTVGTYPVAIAVNANSNKINVANKTSNNVTGIDGATNLTATVGAGSFPMALAINSLTNKIYVANGNGNSVTVIDGASNGTTTVSAGT